MFNLFSDKFDFKLIREAERVWAPLIMFMFTLFVSFILINFFLTIVIDAFTRVRFVSMATTLTPLHPQHFI